MLLLPSFCLEASCSHNPVQAPRTRTSEPTTDLVCDLPTLATSILPSAQNVDQEALTSMDHADPVAGVVRHRSASGHCSQGLRLFVEKGLEC